MSKYYDKLYIRNYMREYIKNAEEYKCECGGKYKTYNKCLHNKTKRHIKYIQNKEDNNETIKKLVDERNIILEECINNAIKKYMSNQSEASKTSPEPELSSVSVLLG